MFFSSRKKKKLAEEAQAQEQARINLKQEVALQETNAYQTNVKTFYRICDMVRSLPKKRQIVVVQRINTFKDDYDRNRGYMELARNISRQHRINGTKWISAYNGSLFAFYSPTRLGFNFNQALKEFSKDGYVIQRIRYYRDSF